ncbi:Na/Pi cotransporter family protein [Variovorax sp. LARHSF232]
MLHLLNLLAAVSLLVWGTHIVRTGMLRLLGGRLRTVIAHSAGNRVRAVLAGLGVTSLVQSSTATNLLVASFLGKGLIATGAALAVMLGAEIGTAVMAVAFSFDLSWLSPLLIFTGVALYISREKTTTGRVGHVIIGLGLITLALHLITLATAPLTESPAVRALLVAMPNDALVDMLVGALLTIVSYSSLAVVLLTAKLADQALVPATVAFGLVLGSNIGSGITALLSNAGAPAAAKRLPVGSLAFKLAGCLIVLPLLPWIHVLLQDMKLGVGEQVIAFHLLFNLGRALLFIAFTNVAGRWLDRWITAPKQDPSTMRPQHLDPAALETPSLAISCAAREALHQADVVESMLRGTLTVIRDNDLALAERLRRMDDVVDDLYTAIKFYLTQVSREALSERESRRWTDIVSFTINMEQIGDIIERVLQQVEDKKIRKNRSFSEAGMAEIAHLHERLIANLRLGMSVFLDGHVREAQLLLEEKARFRDLEHDYAARHIVRLQDNTAQSIETSALHLDLLSELKRINSHLCSIAYPILESAGALAQTRIRHSQLATLASGDD